MAVEHTPSEIVHRGAKGGITGCGTNTKDELDHWKNTSKELFNSTNLKKDELNRSSSFLFNLEISFHNR